MRREVGKALSPHDREKSEHGIVAKVQKKAGEDGTRPGARKGKNNSHKSEQTDKAPSPAKLGAMRETEERTGHQDAGHHARADGARRIHPPELRNARGDSRKYRVEIPTKDRFLHERRDQHCHAHKQHHSAAALEHFLDWDM